MITADINAEAAVIRVVPDYGAPVTFAVDYRTTCITKNPRGWGSKRYAERYVVGTGAGDPGERREIGYATTLERAVRMALTRARQYERAYSKPRTVEARRAVA